jgi:hypothetical protein
MLYIVTLCAFSFYKLIGKLTAFLQLQEFSLRNQLVDSSTTTVWRSPPCESAAFYQLCQVVGSSCCPQSVNSFYGKVGKTLRSHKNQFGDRGDRN